MQKSFFVYTMSLVAFTPATATDVCPVINVNDFKQAISSATMDSSKTRMMFVLNNKRWFMEPSDWNALAQPNASKKQRTILEEAAFFKSEISNDRVRCYYFATMSSPFTTTHKAKETESPNPVFEFPERKSSNLPKIIFKMTYLLPSKEKQSKAS
jgi:hypothetical protein